MALFLTGEYRHQIDEKSRFRIPPKLRNSLGEEPLMTAGPDGCIALMPYLDGVEQINTAYGDIKINSSSATPQHLKEARTVAANAYRASEDNQSRIVLPPSLLKHAGIKKNIVTIGFLSRIEIWSQERWDAYIAGDTQVIESTQQIIEDTKK